MAAEGSKEFTSTLRNNQPKGPFIVDTGGCACALQEQLNTDAWRCLANNPDGIYQGQDGKWFYAVNQGNPASMTDAPNSDSNPPDTATAYEIQDGQWYLYPDDSDDRDTRRIRDITCTGQNQTQASTKFYDQSAALLSGENYPCWQPGTAPLSLQTASQWKATGCKLGFYCE